MLLLTPSGSSLGGLNRISSGCHDYSEGRLLFSTLSIGRSQPLDDPPCRSTSKVKSCPGYLLQVLIILKDAKDVLLQYRSLSSDVKASKMN